MQLQALALNKNDVYAIHALSHVYEMQGKQDKGIKMMAETCNDWNVRGMQHQTITK